MKKRENTILANKIANEVVEKTGLTTRKTLSEEHANYW